MAAQTRKYREHSLAGIWSVMGIVLLGLLFRVALLSLGKYPFNSDEAIVGLMARHTLEGDWPIFFYGQAYMGSLDATLVAWGFSIFGPHVWVIRLVQIVLFIGVLFSSIKLSSKLARSRHAGLVTGLLLAIPTVNLNLYTTVSLGGYGEALLIGNLLLLLGIHIVEARGGAGLFLLLGILAGMGFWAFGLTLIYTLPVFIMLAVNSIKVGSARQLVNKAGLVLLGFLVGILPIVFWVFEHGIGALFAELFGSALAGISGSGYWQSVRNHIGYFIIFGISATFGLRPPWSTEIFFWPLAVVVGLFWIAVLTQYLRNLRGKEGDTRVAKLLGGVLLCLLLGFVFTPFGGDPSGRYFLPVGVISTIMAGTLFSLESTWIPRALKWILLVAVVAYQLLGNIQVALNPSANFSTQFDPVARIDHGYDEALMRFLSEQGELRGYTNYWVAYPIAFKSDEEIIFIPRLPYHQDFRYTSRDDRYAPYNDLVTASDQVAYITTNHPELDDKIRTRFQELDVVWDEHMIGDFQIFYNLSKPVLPENIDVRLSR